MEFFYVDDSGTEQGPFTEREMTDWLREYPTQLSEDLKIRVKRPNEKDWKPTLKMMRSKNGHFTPFIFAKCERDEQEKKLREELNELKSSTEQIDSMAEELRTSIAQTTRESRQLMERLQRRIDAAVKLKEEELKREEELKIEEELKKEEEEEEKEQNVPSAPSDSQPPPSPAKSTTSQPSSFRQISQQRVFPLFDVAKICEDDEEIGEEGEPELRRELRGLLDEVDLDEAQKDLYFPVKERCRSCDKQLAAIRPSAGDDLRNWIVHITTKNHLEKFRLRGGRVTKECFQIYITLLRMYTKIEEKEEEEPVDEGTVDLEKKKLECYMGVIMLPLYIPLLHIDPSDTTKMNFNEGRRKIDKLRKLIFHSTDKYAASKSLHLPTTTCELCNEKFDYAPKLVPHLLTNTHIDKYLAARGSFSKHDIEFWTEICLLFPEAGKDSRDTKEVRAQLRDKLGKILDISNCKNSMHYNIYGSEDRKRHVVQFIMKQLIEHQRHVVVYIQSEDSGNEVMEYVKEQLPNIKIGSASIASECEDLEVIITDSSLRLTRPHAIAFPSAPLTNRQKADYAQKMCGEYVEANLIIAFGVEEQTQLRYFSRRAAVPTSTSSPHPPPIDSPTEPEMPPEPTEAHTATTVLQEPSINPIAATVPPPVSPSIPTNPANIPNTRSHPPIASVPPFSSSYRPTPPPSIPLNQRRYDPNQAKETPTSPPETQKSKCSIM